MGRIRCLRRAEQSSDAGRDDALSVEVGHAGRDAGRSINTRRWGDGEGRRPARRSLVL